MDWCVLGVGLRKKWQVGRWREGEPGLARGSGAREKVARGRATVLLFFRPRTTAEERAEGGGQDGMDQIMVCEVCQDKQEGVCVQKGGARAGGREEGRVREGGRRDNKGEDLVL